MMKKLTQTELDYILQQHSLWLQHQGGERAVLNNTDLSHLNLEGAVLHRANLTRTNFTNANLCDADMSDADITYAIFKEADLNNAS